MIIGQRVDRIEQRRTTSATVLEIEGDNARLSYDEGGEGWWPMDSLVVLPDDEDDD